MRSRLSAPAAMALALCATQLATPSHGAAAVETPSTAFTREGLTGEMLYQFLLAEIAAQRGRFTLASETTLKLARGVRDPRIAQRATELALHARSPALALEAASLWIELDPESTQARHAATALLLSAGRFEDAKAQLKWLLAADAASAPRTFLQLNTTLGRHADKTAVLKLLSELAADYPEMAEARYAVAQAALNAKQDELAVHQSAVALQLRDGWEAAALLHGQAFTQISPPDALVFYKGFLSSNPKAVDIRLAYAKLLVAQKDMTAARTQFKALLANTPNNADMNLAIAMLSVQLNDYDGADAYLKQALKFNYKEPDLVRLYLGQVSEERKRYDDATEWYKQVTPGEQYLGANIRVAAVLAKQGKLDDGRAYLRTLKAQNGEQDALLTQADAQLLREAKDYQGAYNVLTAALSRHPDSPDLLYDRAMAAEKVEKIEVLERDLRKVIELKPDFAHAYNALGYTLADRTDRLGEALELIEKAHKLAPDDPFILDSLGWVQYRLGNIEVGASYLRSAHTARPDPEIAAHLGEVLWMQGSRAEAEKIWATSLKEHPDNESLLSVIKKFKH